MKAIRMAMVFVLVTGISTAARGADSDAVKKDLDQLQGEWSMVSGSADGQMLPDEILKDMKRICKGNETTVTRDGQPFFKAKFTIDPSKKPKTIDYEVTDGETKGKKQLGIYELDGDSFKACFARPDAERPTDFKPGEGHTTSVWKRAKASISKEPAK